MLGLGLNNFLRIAMMEDDMQTPVEREGSMLKAKNYDDDSFVKVW